MKSLGNFSIYLMSTLVAGSAMANDADIEAVSAKNYREVLSCIEAYEFVDVNQQAPVYDEWCPAFASYIDEHTRVEKESGYKGECSVQNIGKLAYALLERKRLAAGGGPFMFKTVAHTETIINQVQPVLDASCPS